MSQATVEFAEMVRVHWAKLTRVSVSLGLHICRKCRRETEHEVTRTASSETLVCRVCKNKRTFTR